MPIPLAGLNTKRGGCAVRASVGAMEGRGETAFGGDDVGPRSKLLIAWRLLALYVAGLFFAVFSKVFCLHDGSTTTN